MRFLIQVLGCVLVSIGSTFGADTTWAGPNSHGTLVLARVETIDYTGDLGDYCDMVQASTCEELVSGTPSDGSGDGPLALSVLAAFPSSANPRLMGTTFGLTYTPGAGFGAIAAFGGCGAFELADPTWPNPDTGTAVTWATAETGTLIDVYWLAVYAYTSVYGTGSLELRTHPVQGGNFADDSTPADVDPIAAFGTFGFGIDGGVVPCPISEPVACCFDDYSCVLLFIGDCVAAGGAPQPEISCDPIPCTIVEGRGACCFGAVCEASSATLCAAAGGDYLGDSSECEPNPCPFVGACCSADGQCQPLTEPACLLVGGAYLGAEVSCFPDPCTSTPTHGTTWGTIKDRFR